MRRAFLAAVLFAVACGGDSETTDDDDGGPGSTTSSGEGGATSTVGPGGQGGAGVGGGSGGPFATCGEAGPTGEHNQVTLASGEYYVWAPNPPNDPASPYPLVVALHGDEGHPDQAVSYIWGAVWNAHQDFVLVAPVCPSAQGSWWQGDTSGYAVFLHQVIDDVASKYNIDIARSFATGYSGGSCWLSAYAFEFQDVFAGIQWTCGGCNPNVTAPPAPNCKVDGRFHIAADDFLLDGAQATADAMTANGHAVDFVIADCSGHCCMNSPSDAEDALAWFLGRTKCDSTAGSGCSDITTLPP
jgi:poly(3-hydroxybutyrate) depolymerase